MGIRLYKFISLSLLAVILTSCSMLPLPKLMDNKKEENPELDVRIFADKDINPDVLGTPSPYLLISLHFVGLSGFANIRK